MNLAQLLIQHGIIQSQAINDAEHYDGEKTLAAVEKVQAELEAENKALLSRLKAMEEILDTVSHRFPGKHQGSLRDDICPACRWEKLKEGK